MAAMGEEENLWQESVGGITILEAEPLEAMNSARVLATIDVAQEASAHGSSASREIVGVPDPLAVNELQVVIRDNRARKKVISQQNAALLAGAAALGGYVTNSLFAWQSASKMQEKQAQEHQKLANRIRTIEEALSLRASKMQEKQAQEHQKLANRIRTLEEALSLPAMIDVDTTPISQASDATCVSGTRLFVPPSVSVSQALPVGLCTLLAGRYIAQKIQCYRNALAAVVIATTERDAAVARENEAVVRANEEVTNATTERDEAAVRANEAVANANTARDAAIARANEAVVVANTARDAAVTWANEEVARANTARDAAVTWANEAVVIENTERDAAVARENTAREELAARDQEIAQTSNALAVALRIRAFGEAEWKHHFGDVGSAPPLPSNMATILDSTCPFWPNKKVRDTHLLVLIPATVGGVPFTLNLLGELIKHPSHGGHKTEYKYYNERVKAQIGEASPPRSYWVLMTRDVLSDSRNKTYEAQKVMVAAHAGRVGLPYELPHALEAATAILMHHAREGERLFGDHPWTYTRCQEVVDGYPVVVGGFSSGCLRVYDDDHVYYFDDHDGVSCLRKF